MFPNLPPININSDNKNDSKTAQSNIFQSVEGINCIPDPEEYEIATLLDVIDGDSIRVAIEGSIYEVRYIGMDTPEYNSDQRPAAVKATEMNKRLLNGQVIYLLKDRSETDKYGRLLRYVISNGKFVNLEMVKNGYACSKAYNPDTSCQALFDAAEKK